MPTATVVALLVFVVSAAAAGCGATVTPLAVQDAQLGARVKTAIVNDPQLGTHPIEVRVLRGVVRLSGRVDSEAQVQRAVSIASAVPGVADVLSDLRTGAAEIPPPSATTDQQGLVVEEDREPHLIAVGISIGRSTPGEDGLGSQLKIGPLVRLGSGSGIAPAIGFGWFQADWRANLPGAPLLGRVRVRPVMGGLAYGFRGRRGSVSFSLVGGVAFNGLSLTEVVSAREIPLSIGKSLAVRPGASLWFDLDRRFAINLAGGYLMTRPRVRVLEDGQVRTRSLRADAILINAGIVYKVF